MNELLTMRAIERILNVLFAGISIYLGYRLFLAAGAAAPQGSEGRLEAGKYKFRMAKVGAGAFFAMFGAVVMVVSLLSKADVKDGAREGHYMTPAQDSIGSEVVLQRVTTLNRVAWNLRPDLSQHERQEILSRIADLKASQIESIWQPSWGDVSSKRAFRAWAAAGGQGAGPAGLKAPAELFHAGAPQ